MSKFKIVDQDKYTAVVFDEKADRTFTAAVGPVQRLQVLAEIQDDPGCNTSDLAIALVIERHVGKTGFAKIKQETISTKSGVSLRTVERRLKELDAVHGHIAQIRQGPTASLFFLMMQEPASDAVPEESKNRSKCGSREDKEPPLDTVFKDPKEPPTDTVLADSENRHEDGSDKALSDLSEDQRTANRDTKNRQSRHEEPPFDANVHYTELSYRTQLQNSGAPSRRQRASSAQADAAPSPREPASVALYQASPFPKDSSLSSDGSLTRLMARSPSEEDSKNGKITPLAGEKIPQTSQESRSGAAFMWADDDTFDDDSDMNADDEERLLEKERREEARDDEIMRQRNSSIVDDGLDADHPF